MESTLAYVLTHYLLDDCDFPWWLKHGLCQHFSELYDQGEGLPQVNRLASWQKEASDFWTRERLDGLWDGSILLSEEKERAEIFSTLLTRAILEKVADIPKFLDDVHWEDGGAGAIQNHSGFDLNHFSQRILGPGDWAPR